MPTRIPGGGIARRNPNGPEWSRGAPASETGANHPVEERLFGHSAPPLLDEDDEACSAQMRRLATYKRKFALLAQDRPEDYTLKLAKSPTMAINREGLIYVGKEFLIATASSPNVSVGALAHEIGHRPKRWRAYRQARPRTEAEIRDLCRLEETRADFFAGYAMAQVGLDIEPLCAYLFRVQTEPHPAYFPPRLRGQTLREGYESGTRRKQNVKKFYPELARLTSAAGDLGEG